tara:strand:- start:433 stop:1386 length:954 start_codon:yes stop_codon:yes gene_type:complete
MFANKTLERKLEKALNLAANQIFSLDPATRSLTLKAFKHTIWERDEWEKTRTPFSDDQKESVELTEKIIEKVEKLIEEEEFEGEGYVYGLNAIVTEEEDFLIWEKLSKAVKSFFPSIEAAMNDFKVPKEDDIPTKAKFGDPNYPTDIRAFSQSLFLHLRSRQVALVDQGYPMSFATKSSIQMAISYVTPDDFIIENESAKESFSPQLLLKSKNEITNLKGYIKWMDENMIFDELKIGDLETDYYRTKEDFINDIDPDEVFNIISIAWEDCTDKAKMKKIRVCEKKIKDLINLGESKENTIEIINIIKEFQFFYRTNF